MKMQDLLTSLQDFGLASEVAIVVEREDGSNDIYNPDFEVEWGVVNEEQGDLGVALTIRL